MPSMYRLFNATLLVTAKNCKQPALYTKHVTKITQNKHNTKITKKRSLLNKKHFPQSGLLQ